MGLQHGRWSKVVALSLALCGAGAVVGSASLAYSAGAARARLAPPTAVVAVFDLERVFGELEERKAREGDLQNYVKSLQGELDALVASAKDLTDKATTLPDGPEKSAAAAKAIEAQLQARVKKEVSDAMVENRKTTSFVDLYNKVNDAVKRLATQNNYTIVISTDEKAGIPMGADAQGIQRLMQLKRVFYTAGGHDITSDLVTLLNNEYKASAGNKPN